MWGMDWDAPLNQSDRDAMIETVADQVTKRGMTVPAILFLEMHKPLGFLAGQTLIFGAGFLAPIVGPKNLQKWAKLIENPDDVERLIRRIETLRSSDAPPKNREQGTGDREQKMPLLSSEPPPKLPLPSAGTATAERQG